MVPAVRESRASRGAEAIQSNTQLGATRPRGAEGEVMGAQCQTCGGPLAHDEFPCVACIPPNILAVMLDAIRRERDTLRAQLADHESEIASLTDSINNARRNAGIHADVDSLVVERLKSAIWELSYKVVEREAQLAAAQRVPEDAELDALAKQLVDACSCETDFRCESCDWLSALIALRRRVAELAVRWERVRNADKLAIEAEIDAAIAKEPQDA